MNQPIPPSLSAADVDALKRLRFALGNLGQNLLSDGELSAAAGRLLEHVDRVSSQGVTPAPPIEPLFGD